MKWSHFQFLQTQLSYQTTQGFSQNQILWGKILLVHWNSLPADHLSWLNALFFLEYWSFDFLNQVFACCFPRLKNIKDVSQIHSFFYVFYACLKNKIILLLKKTKPPVSITLYFFFLENTLFYILILKMDLFLSERSVVQI